MIKQMKYVVRLIAAAAVFWCAFLVRISAAEPDTASIRSGTLGEHGGIAWSYADDTGILI